MKKLGIMGGTFNPIHNGHMAVAKAAMDEYNLDRIMFLPNFQPPHKESATSAQLRLEMVQTAVEGEERYFVSDYEISRGGISYSVDTLREFKKIYPDRELYFIIGGDSLRDFGKWYKPEETVKYCILLVYPRNDINLDTCIDDLRTRFGARIEKLTAPELDISSSDIRDMIKAGKSPEGLVPQSILSLIENNNLYKG